MHHEGINKERNRQVFVMHFSNLIACCRIFYSLAFRCNCPAPRNPPFCRKHYEQLRWAFRGMFYIPYRLCWKNQNPPLRQWTWKLNIFGVLRILEQNLQYLLHFYLFTLAWRTFSVCFFDISGAISASYLHSLLLTVRWGLGIHRLWFYDISDTNLVSGDDFAVGRTHQFVVWLDEGVVILFYLKELVGGSRVYNGDQMHFGISSPYKVFRTPTYIQCVRITSK